MDAREPSPDSEPKESLDGVESAGPHTGFAPSAESRSEEPRSDEAADSDFPNADSLGMSPATIDVVWRKYQADVLAQLAGEAIAPPVHLVAPPGAGKTLLGLELARRRGMPAVVLSPTTTVAEQWFAQATRYLRHPKADAPVATRDVGTPAWLTSLTYQMLSTVEESEEALIELARQRWVEELCADRAHSGPEAAHQWLEALSLSNPARYDAGVRRRATKVRRELVQASPDDIARYLHPNALAALDSLVDVGVGTVILDECHHLLDHWAIVARYLIAQIDAAGRAPYVVGLTATLPDSEDETSFANYSALLGEVDYDVPTPAVVREGDLAPYRELLYLCNPTETEREFIDSAHDAFAATVDPVLDGERFRDWLIPQFLVGAWGYHLEERIEAAYDDVEYGSACAWWFHTHAPDSPITAYFPSPAFSETESRMALIARYAHEMLLPDPACDAELAALRSALGDFGVTLTDRGVRSGRSVGDLVLSSSAAKSVAVCDIIEAERAALGDRMRALVVCDFAQHTNRLGNVFPDRRQGAAAGVMAAVTEREECRALTPVLMTASTLQISGDATAFLVTVNDHLGGVGMVSDPIGGLGVRELEVDGARSGQLAAAVTAALSAGATKLLIATRGLVGEGWDCPALNTLVDVTTVATAAGARQLHGRVLRLDPQWPEKVAHNWSVCCIDTGHDGGLVDLERVARRHDFLWGPDIYTTAPDAEGAPVAEIVTGLRHLRTPALDTAIRWLPTAGAFAAHNQAVVDSLDARQGTRSLWAVGSPFHDTSRDEAALDVPKAPSSDFRYNSPLYAITSSLTFGIAVAGEICLRSSTTTGWRWGLVIAAVIMAVFLLRTVKALRVVRSADGIIAPGARAVAEALMATDHLTGPVAISVVTEGSARSRQATRISLDGTPRDNAVVLTALRELFGLIGHPRFVLRRNDGRLAVYGRRLSDAVYRVLARVWLRRHEHYLAVPSALSRRRGDAERFYAIWKRHVGPAGLIEVRGPQGAVMLNQARRQNRPAKTDGFASWS